MTTHSIPFVRSLEIGELPSDILRLIFSLLHGQHIVKCIRVCRTFSDLIHSDLYLQYRIALAQSGMVDGHSSSLPLPERLQRLRDYISNFRNGTFNREILFENPVYSNQAVNVIMGSFTPVYHTEDSSALYRRMHPAFGTSLSVVSHGSAQAGVQSHHSVIPFRIPSPEDPWRLVDKWAINEAQDLLVTIERESPHGTQRRPPEVHFYSLGGSKGAGAAANHPDAAQPHWQIALPYSTEPTPPIEFFGIWIAAEQVVWEIRVHKNSVRVCAIEVYNWRTGQITSRIGLSNQSMHVVVLDRSYLLVTPRGPCPQSRHLIIYNISPSSLTGSRPLCTLQLPGDHKVNLEQEMSLSTMIMTPSSSAPEGHFRADPSVSMVVLTYEGRGAHGGLTTHLLIPSTTILAQIPSVTSAQPDSGTTTHDSEEVPRPARSNPPTQTPIPWEDWGARGSLRLRLPEGAHHRLPKPRIIPFSSRIPIVVFHDDRFRSVSIYVVDTNPLAARHALSSHTRSRGSESQAAAIVDAEDVEEALPGVVDPECSAIPYVVYRFPLPDVPPERLLGYPVWSVQTTMTGFALSLATATLYGSLQSWTV